MQSFEKRKGKKRRMTPAELLNISPNASKKEITKAYHTLSQKYHPDRGGDNHIQILLTKARDEMLQNLEQTNDTKHSRRIRQSQMSHPVSTSTWRDPWNRVASVQSLFDELTSDMFSAPSSTTSFWSQSKTMNRRLDGTWEVREHTNENGNVSEKQYVSNDPVDSFGRVHSFEHWPSVSFYGANPHRFLQM